MTKSKNYKPLDELIRQVDERAPLSTRIKRNTKDFLRRESKARKLKLSSLAAAILDDYAENCPDSQGENK